MDEAKITVNDNGEGKQFKCIKCKKIKQESDGLFIWEGNTFCCQTCYNDVKKEKEKEKEEKGEVCEFC